MTKKTIVVKFGTSTLTQGTPKLNSPHMRNYTMMDFESLSLLRVQLRLADTI